MHHAIAQTAFLLKGETIIFGSMTVAVFAFLDNKKTSGSDAAYLYRLLWALAQNRKEDNFILYTTAPEPENIVCPNLQIILSSISKWPFAPYRLLRQWKQKAVQHGAGIIWHFGLRSYIKTNLNTALSLLEGETNRLALLQHRTILRRVPALMVTLETDKKELIALTGLASEGVETVFNIAGNIEIKEDASFVKDAFTAGSEYYLYYGPLYQTGVLITLLKAFSKFKHRQKTSWKLVLMQSDAAPPLALQQALAHYKYRNDVVLLLPGGSHRVGNVLHAAFGFVFPDKPVHYGRYLLAALAAGPPLIVTTEAKEWLKEGALYFNAGDEEELALLLMQLYKDEKTHLQYKAAAAARKDFFSEQQIMLTLCRALGLQKN